MVELDETARLELSAIDGRAALASAGYVLSPLLLAGATVCLTVGGLGLNESSDWAAPTLVTGALAALGGLVGFGAAIALDVGSGVQRRRWYERHGVTTFALSVAPLGGDGWMVRASIDL